MDEQALLAATESFVHQKMDNEGTGHDWWHIYRVRALAMRIAEIEHANMCIVQMGALLHDIADFKFNNGDLQAGARVTKEFLTAQNVPEDTIQKIAHIVEHVSFKGAGEENKMKSLEGKIVQDADRLDALGAIGVARTFAYGGSKNRALYDPNSKPEHHNTFEEYKNGTGSSINHFYEKLLLVKDRLNTETAKKIAEHRHTYLENFLDEFFAEWEGKR